MTAAARLRVRPGGGSGVRDGGALVEAPRRGQTGGRAGSVVEYDYVVILSMTI